MMSPSKEPGPTADQGSLGGQGQAALRRPAPGAG
jgi:hypothetical protein